MTSLKSSLLLCNNRWENVICLLAKALARFLALIIERGLWEVHSSGSSSLFRSRLIVVRLKVGRSSHQKDLRETECIIGANLVWNFLKNQLGPEALLSCIYHLIIIIISNKLTIVKEF